MNSTPLLMPYELIAKQILLEQAKLFKDEQLYNFEKSLHSVIEVLKLFLVDQKVCSKCGSFNTQVRYHDNFSKKCTIANLTYEHLHYCCNNCRYEWAEDTKN